MSNRKKNSFLSVLLGLLLFSTGTMLIIKAEEDLFGDWFADLLKELEDEEETKRVETPAEQESIATDKASIRQPDKPISQDQDELFINPPIQTVTIKGDKKILPVQEARSAAKTHMTKFVGLLNELEKKIEDIMSGSFTPEFKETYQEYYSGPNSLINISWDSIENNEDFLNMFLSPPKDNKKLVKDLQEQRKTVITLTKELDEIMPQISLTPAPTEEEKAEELEELAEQPRRKKRKRKQVDTSPKKRGRK